LFNTFKKSGIRGSRKIRSHLGLNVTIIMYQYWLQRRPKCTLSVKTAMDPPPPPPTIPSLPATRGDALAPQRVSTVPHPLPPRTACRVTAHPVQRDAAVRHQMPGRWGKPITRAGFNSLKMEFFRTSEWRRNISFTFYDCYYLAPLLPLESQGNPVCALANVLPGTFGCSTWK
jgi:hypothetical protein